MPRFPRLGPVLGGIPESGNTAIPGNTQLSLGPVPEFQNSQESVLLALPRADEGHPVAPERRDSQERSVLLGADPRIPGFRNSWEFSSPRSAGRG